LGPVLAGLVEHTGGLFLSQATLADQ